MSDAAEIKSDHSAPMANGRVAHLTFSTKALDAYAGGIVEVDPKTNKIMAYYRASFRPHLIEKFHSMTGVMLEDIAPPTPVHEHIICEGCGKPVTEFDDDGDPFCPPCGLSYVDA
jgi:hypothetical protein